MTRITTMPDAQAVARRAAREIVRHLSEARRVRGVAHLALSGGTTPASTYQLLGEELEDWSALEVWFVDERCVAAEDPQSNYKLAAQTLLEGAPIDAARVHRMEGELGPDAGAARYSELIWTHVPRPDGSGQQGDGLPVLDLAVLGIGPDGHVASLFPGAPALSAPACEVCLGVRDSPKPPPERITLSMGMLRAARRCLLIATGASKADALRAALAEPSPDVPASLLRRERLTVVADDRASPPGPSR
jgi:6-phosphogluconolactonase